MENKSIQLIIISGMSGAGKTVAMQSMEDLGFFCVDNLPPVFIPKFIELIEQSSKSINKVALVLDLRGREFFDSLLMAMDDLEQKEHFNYQILFLDADDQVLVQRYKETRRRHPLSPDGTPLDGIRKERKLLEELKGRAQQIVNTSNMKPAQLRESMIQRFTDLDQHQLTINMMSFGYKYGIPIDADLVLDVRFLPNPHYIEEMRPKTGLEEEVSSYVLKWADTQTFIKKLEGMLDFLIPQYQREGKSQVVIAIGCTGGKHRSVTLAEYFHQRFIEEYTTRVTHRDINKDR
ncbi:RNase adapter RapZ [Caldalkalibacillus salinus]|uniref:RNase adapter RapZ n=1 Tax=Caldalkalibacillus salinus TaxID=2803787 RepID=UPI0019240A54|nr:RNase adapter RapZ [Caldalkalibacillus salinus]